MAQEKTGKRTVQEKDGVNFTVPIRLMTDVNREIEVTQNRTRGVLSISDVCAAGFVAFLAATHATRKEWIALARTYDLQEPDQPIPGLHAAEGKKVIANMDHRPELPPQAKTQSPPQRRRKKGGG